MDGSPPSFPWLWPEAPLAVRVTVRRVYPNCSRYVHRYQKLQASPFVPHAGCESPEPSWKSSELVRDVVPPKLESER